MSFRKGRIDNARREANKLLRRFGVESAKDVNVEGFADRLQIHLVDAKLHGATAQLVVGPDHASIILSDAIVDMDVRRWAVAHELGHYVLGHPAPPPETLLAPHPRYFNLHLLPDDEVEADCFALTLLTPERAVRAFHDVRPMTLLAPMILAGACGVSPEAGAIRITELTERACAVVLSHGARILVAAPSLRFVEAFGTLLVPGRPLDQCSIASRYFAGETVLQRPEMVPSATWLDLPSEPPILEHSLPGTVPGTVLTMLWAPHRDVGRQHRQHWDHGAVAHTR
jgi:Zn-dependent peptidase ImmA (M78 family)